MMEGRWMVLLKCFFFFFSVDPFKVFISGGEVYRRKENM